VQFTIVGMDFLATHDMMELGLGLVLNVWIDFVAFAYEFCHVANSRHMVKFILG
jgi:hypothetical protein